jgi:hypothetical protein
LAALEDDREESLAQELAKNLPQPVAYINAGYPAKDSKVAAAACSRMLRKRPYINARADELRAMLRDDVKYAEFKGDMESMTKLLIEDRQFARDCKQPGAAVSASSALAKLHRLGGDKPPGDPENPIHHVHEIRRTVVDPKHTDS